MSCLSTSTCWPIENSAQSGQFDTTTTQSLGLRLCVQVACRTRTKERTHRKCRCTRRLDRETSDMKVWTALRLRYNLGLGEGKKRLSAEHVRAGEMNASMSVPEGGG